MAKAFHKTDKLHQIHGVLESFKTRIHFQQIHSMGLHGFPVPESSIVLVSSASQQVASDSPANSGSQRSLHEISDGTICKSLYGFRGIPGFEVVMVQVGFSRSAPPNRGLPLIWRRPRFNRGLPLARRVSTSLSFSGLTSEIRVIRISRFWQKTQDYNILLQVQSNQYQ